jgi:hypothetical protein
MRYPIQHYTIISNDEEVKIMLVFETEKITQRKAAITAGIAMLIVAVSAMFAVGAVQNRLVDWGNAAATTNNILESIGLFRAGIFSWLITLTADIVTAWALYIFLKQVDNSLALLSAWFRVAYAIILGTAVMNFVLVTLLLGGDKIFSSIQNSQLQIQVMLSLNAFRKMWSFGLIIFGIHLFITSFLVVKLKFIPKVLGILLFLASISYVFIHIMHLFLPQYDNITAVAETILSLPMAVGELGLGVWLLIKGGKVAIL